MPGRDRPLRLLVAAGGTGGHLYPALAVARELERREPEAEVIFVGTARGLETTLVPRAGYRLELVRVAPLRGGNLLRKVNGALSILTGLRDAVRLIRRWRPRMVMGVGGYASGPLLAAAALGGIPTLILEPNAVPGWTNRWLARLVDAAALGWEETTRYFGAKAFVSGNPVREEIARAAARLPNSDLRLLVFGGSQGSHALNEAMVAALAHLRPHRDRIRVVHQTGAADLARVRAAYEAWSYSARVEAYLDAMEKEYEQSNLVLSRAGATTCAELAAAGRPAILVPLPLAGAHQSDNAKMMERAGAACMIAQEELGGERLARDLIALLEAPEKRKEMAERSRRLARPDAARLIVDRLLSLAARGEEKAA